MATDLFSRLGIETYGFRNFPTHTQVVELTRACGVDKIELCATHFDPASQDHALALSEYAKGGVTITTFFSFSAFGEDEAKDRGVFEFAKLAGLQTVVGDIASGKEAQADKLAARYGKRIAIHNHGRHHNRGSVWGLEELFGRTSPSIGLCLDTGWALDSGEDPVEFARRFRDRLYGLHIKDFVFDRAGHPEDVIVGTGNLALDALNRYLIETNYDGFYSLEYEGDADNPVPTTKQCVDAIRTSLQRIG